MKDIRKEIRERYTEAWFLFNFYSVTMAPKPTPPIPKATSTYDEDQQQLEEYIENSSTVVPPVSELLSRVNRLDSIKLPDSQVIGEETIDHDEKQRELELLMSTQDQSATPVELPEPSAQVINVSDTDAQNDDDYEESFASQRETSQLREDYDSLAAEMIQLRSQFDLVMKERSNLPEIIGNIRSDLNSQLTQFSDKMYSLIESKAPAKEIQSAMSTIEEVRMEQADQLKTAAGYLSSEPKPTSPIVTKGVSLKGKGKFKPIK